MVWQFQDTVVSESVETSVTKGVGARAEGAAQQQEFLDFCRSDMSDLASEDLLGWDLGSLAHVPGSSSSRPALEDAGLKSKLGIRGTKEEGNAVQKEIDLMSTVPDDATKVKLLQRVLKLKSFAEGQKDGFMVMGLTNKKLLKHGAYVDFEQALTSMQAFVSKGPEKMKVREAREVMAGLGSSLKKMREVADRLQKEKEQNKEA